MRGLLWLPCPRGGRRGARGDSAALRGGRGGRGARRAWRLRGAARVHARRRGAARAQPWIFIVKGDAAEIKVQVIELKRRHRWRRGV